MLSHTPLIPRTAFCSEVCIVLVVNEKWVLEYGTNLSHIGNTMGISGVWNSNPDNPFQQAIMVAAVLVILLLPLDTNMAKFATCHND